ncbi:amino acid ABC transporter ATP-binding protein [Lacticaseibacillus hulanensis]|uniref:amino acid ABC transporter ATP-binding protein n=1 Tax=Lacticaseibacillus hulanensis TaxID=2493111 RepID=UPI000FD7390A|nr:amino acid ABC transporter ATP-binding protein [Lacticaseibacillus hulanensis]
MAEELLRVEHLKKSYQSKEVLHDINFAIHKGEVVALLGSSGSGKSTLIRTLNGLEDYQGGTITFAGETVHPSKATWLALRQRIGMVFQSYDLFPNLSVLDNILLGPLKVQHRSRAEAEEDARKLLASVNLADYADRYPRQLSGGQKQRIAIVRALALHPEMMLFDEVTASLDPEMVRGVLDIMTDLAKRDMTMIVVTHEMNFAREVADRVLFLSDGEILEDRQTAEFFAHPATKRAQEFLASMEF